MKKIIFIILTISILLVSCRMPDPNGVYDYYIHSTNDNLLAQAKISMITSYKLPSHRQDDFVDTMALLLEESSLLSDREIYIGIYILDDKNYKTSFVKNISPGDNDYIIKRNENFDKTIKDITDKNYYEVVFYTRSYKDPGVEGSIKKNIAVHFRQEAYKDIRIMLMIQDEPEGVYKYKCNVLLDGFSEMEVYGGDRIIPKNVPDILK